MPAKHPMFPGHLKTLVSQYAERPLGAVVRDAHKRNTWTQVLFPNKVQDSCTLQIPFPEKSRQI